jgi:hypothetical protein
MTDRIGEDEVAAVIPHHRNGTQGTQGGGSTRKFKGASASAHEEIQSQDDPE